MTLPRKPSRGQAIRADLIGQIIDYMRESTPVQGPNILVSRTSGGSVISGKGGAGGAASGTEPWTVRKHVTEDDENGQWEIWLPPGCMSVGQSLTAINLAASEGTGHDDDKAGWYVLVLDEEEGDAATTTEGEGDDAVTTTARTWDIVAHGKTSAKIYGVDDLDAPARRLLFVSARKRLSANEQEGQTDAQKVAGTWGDEFSQVVATITIGTRSSQDGAAQNFRKVTQIANAPISVAARARSNFDLVWYYDVSQSGVLSVHKVYCVRNSTAVAGMTIDGPDMTDVTGAQSSIWARIGWNVDANENVLTVVADPTHDLSDSYRQGVIWLKIYDMTDNAATADYRSSSLVNIQTFR